MGAVGDELFDRGDIDFAEEVGFRKAGPAGHGRGVEHLLQRGVGQHVESVECWAQGVSQWPQQPLARFELAEVGGCDANDGPAAQFGREMRGWRRCHHGGDDSRLGWEIGTHVTAQLQRFDGLAGRMHDHAAEHRADIMELESEGGHYPEIAAAAAQSPHQFGVGGVVDVQDRPVGGHQLRGDQVVRGQAMRSAEPADAHRG